MKVRQARRIYLYLIYKYILIWSKNIIIYNFMIFWIFDFYIL